MPDPVITIRLISLVLLIFFFPRLAGAQEPNLRQILARSRAAMGGQEKLKSIRSRQVFASVKRMQDGATGRYELLTQYPGQFYYRLSIGNQFEQAAFSDITGYKLTSDTPIQYFNYKAADLIVAEAIYRNGYWYHDEVQGLSGGDKAALAMVTAGISLLWKFEKVSYAGQKEANGHVLQGIRFNLGGSNAEVRAYFDQTTGHLSREEIKFGDLLEIYLYEDYRIVNGIQEPHLIYLQRGSDEYEIKVEKIAYNQSLELAQFETPAGIHSGLPALEDILLKARVNQEQMLRNYDQFTYEREIYFTDSSCTTDSITMNSDCEQFDRRQIYDVQFHRGYPLLVITADDHKNINLSRSRFLFSRSLHPTTAREKRLRQGKTRIDQMLQSNPQRASEGFQKLERSWGRDIWAVLRYAQFSNLRPTMHEQRLSYAVDFVPAPEGDYGAEAFVEQTAGTLYIDAANHFVALMKTCKTEKVAGRRVPTLHRYSAERTQTRFCDDLWLPAEAWGSLSSFKLFGGEFFNSITYCNYRRNGQRLICSETRNWSK